MSKTRYIRGDHVRLTTGAVGMILRVWDNGDAYDVGILDADIPMGDERKRLYDVPATDITGHVKQVTTWVDVP